MLRIAMLLTALLPAATASSYNDLVLKAVQEMPSAGGYSVSSEASKALRGSIAAQGEALFLQAPKPSYCSGATYHVFLSVVDHLIRRGRLELGAETLELLKVAGQPDGHGVWGRWNANGPGTARFFRELDLGRNFTSLDEALPGDFLKIFWTDAVGRDERGHSVVFLGLEEVAGSPHLRFWSSNKPEGYGAKSVPLTKVKRALFSRLERPENLKRLSELPLREPYLATLLSRPSSFAEACRLCGVR